MGTRTPLFKVEGTVTPAFGSDICTCTQELVIGHLFKTQPNPKFLDPTQPIIDTWYGILGYTDNLLLHVTDKFTVHRRYILQANCQ